MVRDTALQAGGLWFECLLWQLFFLFLYLLVSFFFLSYNGNILYLMAFFNLQLG